MDKWEYCENGIHRGEILKNANALGQEGWELVAILTPANLGIIPEMRGPGVLCIFKRKVADDGD